MMLKRIPLGLIVAMILSSDPAFGAGQAGRAATRALGPFEPVRDWYFRGGPLPTAGSKECVRMSEYYATHPDDPEVVYWAAQCQSLGLIRTNRTTLDLLSEAAGKGNTMAMARMGLAYVMGDNVPADPERGLRLLREAHEKGDPIAALNLGQIYLYGNGVPKDFDVAEGFLNEAIERGNIRAYALLSDLHAKRGELQKALSALTKSAEAGDEVGMEYLGEVYRDGKYGVVLNSKSAISWIKRAAERGNVVAKREMAKMLLAGYGGLAQSENNWAMARKLLDSASRQGDRESVRIEAGLYMNGQKGYGFQPRKALDLLRQAAADGDGEAMYQLAVLYVEGLEVPRDLKRAQELMEKSDVRGFGLAKPYLRRLRATTQPAVEPGGSRSQRNGGRGDPFPATEVNG